MGLVGLNLSLVYGPNLQGGVLPWLCLVNLRGNPAVRANPQRPSSYRQRRFRSGIGAHVWGPTQSVGRERLDGWSWSSWRVDAPSLKKKRTWKPRMMALNMSSL